MSEQKAYSVLIVDDETSNIMALTKILSPYYTIYAAKNGSSGIAAAEKYLPDVILLDIIMPGMDGYEVIAALKSSDRTKNAPVIFITGLIDAEDEEKGLALGAVDYIGKPFHAAIVKLRVQNQIKIIEQMRTIIAKELAEESSRARSEFLSRVSHDMRTPMNAIIGMTQLAKRSGEAGISGEQLGKIDIASRQLLRLIDNVLDTYDIESNELELECSEFSFTSLIEEVVDSATAITEKRHTFTTNIDPAIPDALVGDGKRLAQVISNLLSNAGKFTPERGLIQLKAFALGSDDGMAAVRIEVHDNGIGISKKQQGTLFTPFWQPDKGVARKHGGAGLGLAVSKHVAGLMEGDIVVESEVGKGSIFAFTFKMRKGSPASARAGAACRPASFAGRTVLLADDIDINREIVMSMFGDSGLEFECASDGHEALEIFSAAPERFDVIMMDINMPGMDGVEATRRIRAHKAPEGATVPIIALTANVLGGEVEGYFKAGMNDHIGKPVDFDDLSRILEKHL